MSRPPAPRNLVTLKAALAVAERQGYALGSFAPRYTAMIRPILRAAERARSPAIVQISQREMERYGIAAAAFGDRRLPRRARGGRRDGSGGAPSRPHLQDAGDRGGDRRRLH